MRKFSTVFAIAFVVIAVAVLVHAPPAHAATMNFNNEMMTSPANASVCLIGIDATSEATLSASAQFAQIAPLELDAASAVLHEKTRAPDIPNVTHRPTWADLPPLTLDVSLSKRTDTLAVSRASPQATTPVAPARRHFAMKI